jgi:hypothetical protein
MAVYLGYHHALITKCSNFVILCNGMSYCQSMTQLQRSFGCNIGTSDGIKELGAISPFRIPKEQSQYIESSGF